VTVGGKSTIAIGDAGHDLEDDIIAIAAFSDECHWLGYGADQRPRPAADVATAGSSVLGIDIQDAVFSHAPAEYAKTRHCGVLQVWEQMDLGFFGNPARAAGQYR
jgi:hypothetical protein